MFAGAERSKYKAWFVLYGDFVASGMKAKPYALALSKNENVTTVLPPRQTEDLMNAIKRCVAKYGTIERVQAEHAKWCKANRYAYADASNLKKFAPEGQRAKNDKPDAKQALYATVSLNRQDAVKRLMAGGKSRAEANAIATLLGIK